MQRSPLYSRTRRSAPSRVYEHAPAQASSAPPPRPAPASHGPRRRRLHYALALLLGLAGLGLLAASWRPAPHAPTLQEIDRAVRSSLMKQPLPSISATAAAKIGPSVVRVVAYEDADDGPPATAPADGAAKPPRPEARARRDTARLPRTPMLPGHGGSPSIGTGVIVQDNGTILTNLHVVDGAQRVSVQFHDGLVSDARVVNADRSQDLAVIRATRLPDDLQPATLRGTADLRPGDHVVAVGFPFGIGPSVSAGVVSGLEREFRTPDGARTLKHLIQFDAAANPGNSGGPLVTQGGEVVGIVTAILNPTPARTFVGIGFAVPIENAAAAAGMPPF